MKLSLTNASALVVAVLLAACGQPPVAPTSVAVAASDNAEAPGTPLPPARMAFLERIRQHCGQAFAGRIIADEPPPTGDDPFTGKALVMHVRECGETEVRIPFHVGEDRSRTWVLTLVADALRLKHDHRHEDGMPDATTLYGGDTTAEGTGQRQEFPVDAESITLFEAEGRAVSTTNTWAMEIEPGQRFVYELSRPGGRMFRVEFDLSAPVEPPPAPWGFE